MADDLYRARFEVFAASVFHPVKLAADAMLDLVLRRLGAEAGAALLPEDRVLDDGRRRVIRSTRWWRAEPRRRPLSGPDACTERYGASTTRSGSGPATGSARALSLDPSWRTEAETALTARLPGAGRGT